MARGAERRMAELEYPSCATCRRPMKPWADGALTTFRPKPGQPMAGKYVCQSPLCNKYGLVVRVDPPSARGGRIEA